MAPTVLLKILEPLEGQHAETAIHRTFLPLTSLLSAQPPRPAHKHHILPCILFVCICSQTESFEGEERIIQSNGRN